MISLTQVDFYNLPLLLLPHWAGKSLSSGKQQQQHFHKN